MAPSPGGHRRAPTTPLSRAPLGPRVSRRSLLRGLGMGVGAGLVLPATSSLLAACGDQLYTSGSLVLASPDNPVRWPLSSTIPRIEPGQMPEPGSTLRLYNYADYIGPGVVKAFEEEYDVKVSISTFNDTDEALTKIATGAVSYDIYFPSYDQIGKMVAADLLRPLTPDYLPNVSALWEEFTSPWYDVGARYSVPYSTYSTGIGWRTDMVDVDVAALDNPYDVLWDPANRGNAAVIDDWHTTMSLVLLRNGITDVNSGKARDLDLLRSQLVDLQEATEPKVTVQMYNDLPSGQYGVSMMWSGDIVNAQYYLPKDVPVELLRYWFPPDGRGMVDNDLMVVLGSGANPVAAHHFINYMLDPEVAAKNFFYTGYQPPQRAIDPERVVAEGYVPENLATAAVRPVDFSRGFRLLELDPVVDGEWHAIWQEYKARG